jgi:tight adherence protein B
VIAVTLLLAALAAVLLVAAVGSFGASAVTARRTLDHVRDLPGGGATSRLDAADALLRRTRLGTAMRRELDVAGSPRRPVEVLLAGLGIAAAVSALLWFLLAPAFVLVGVLAGLVAVRVYLGRARFRRREAFVAQMPELARVLANATHAGLSVSTAIGIAVDEMDEPARTELSRVSTSLAYGNSLDDALGEMRDRLPSRELRVLLSTILVSARSGGSLVTSLQTIADTLEQRKETRREIVSLLSQSVATGYTVMVLGVLMLVGLNLIGDDTVERMTLHPIGQIALLVAAGLYVLGFLLIRSLTRIKE